MCVCADKFIFHFLFGDRVRIGHKSMPTLDTLNEIVLIVHKTRAALASHPLKAHSGRQKIIFFCVHRFCWCSRCLSTTLQSLSEATRNSLIVFSSHRLTDNRRVAYTQLEENASIMRMRLNDSIRSARIARTLKTEPCV